MVGVGAGEGAAGLQWERGVSLTLSWASFALLGVEDGGEQDLLGSSPHPHPASLPLRSCVCGPPSPFSLRVSLGQRNGHSSPVLLLGHIPEFSASLGKFSRQRSSSQAPFPFPPFPQRDGVPLVKPPDSSCRPSLCSGTGTAALPGRAGRILPCPCPAAHGSARGAQYPQPHRGEPLCWLSRLDFVRTGRDDVFVLIFLPLPLLVQLGRVGAAGAGSLCP